ncbi:DNA modification methylase [Leucobacter luti]|uniref:DNA modification methylase n=1 Tax=Leucobacter luti TaxID=340320 RepID=A0A4Q7TYS7_9MICO|nr:DNA modification methylase [Leucobacter luti]MBL3698946.1 DNA modification methylase [Leucobacter luti]RZT66324.1 hypothetical protein EV139_1760 [Leucobacter luti]
MKIRIASSIAIAAALALGATGCSLIAPQGTLEHYAPSDGIDVTIANLDVRNMMLVADESGENFNVVFGAVNLTGAEQDLAISFTSEGAQKARAEFTIPTGNTLFGNPAGEETPVLVTIPGAKPGATVDAYFQKTGEEEVRHSIPVLDGTLPEYRDYVLPTGFSEADVKSSEKKLEAEDEAASQSTTNDDQEATEETN